ncbi:MAG: hypothetical protein WCP86_06280 [bacterium]
MMRSTVTFSAVIGVWLIGISIAIADDGNYQNFIIGERAQGMGGAVGAFASSLDACFFNPAGLARVKDSTLSVSANLYGFQKYEAANGLAPGEDLKRNSFVGIPAAVSGISKLEGKGAWAISAFIPDRRSFNEIAAFVSKKHFYNFSEDDQTIWVGPSFGYPCSDKLFLGASLFGVYRTYSRVENMSWGDVNYSYSDDLKYDSFGMLAVLGAQYALGGNWSAGFVLQTPSRGIAGSGTFSATQVSLFSGSTALYGEGLQTGDYVPMKVSASVGWQKPMDRAVGFEVTYHGSGDFDLVSGDLQGAGVTGGYDALHVTRKAVVDINLGGEYYYNGIYPLRLGFFTSQSSALDADPTRSMAESRIPQIDKYGITGSLGKETKNMAVNVGLIYLMGSGDAYGWVIDARGQVDAARVDAKERQLYMFLSTSFFF